MSLQSAIGILILFAILSAGTANAQLSASTSREPYESAIEDRVSQARAKSAALSPKDREAVKALFSSAFQLWKSGDFRAARLGFEDGLARDPANGIAQFYLAETLMRLNGRRAARVHYEMAAILIPATQEGLKARAALSTLRPVSRITVVIPQEAPNYQANISTPWGECNSRNVGIGALLVEKLPAMLSDKFSSVNIVPDTDQAKATQADRIIVVTWSDFSADMESRSKGNITFEIRISVHGNAASPFLKSFPQKQDFEWKWGALSNLGCADFRRDSVKAAEDGTVRAVVVAIQSALEQESSR